MVTLDLLLEQSERLQLRLLSINQGRCVTLDVDGSERRAWLCENSAEYHAHRLAIRDTARAVSLVVCLHHNSALPVDCLSLEDGQYYPAYGVPVWYSHEMRRTRRGNSVFIGLLRCGIAEAYDILETLPRSTRQRYQQRLLATARRGRPITI